MKIGRATIEEAEQLIAVLSCNHKTKSSAVKTDILLKKYRLGYSARHLRMVIELIRKNDLAAPAFLVSNTQVGYWITSDLSEMKAFLNQELDRVSNQVDNINTLRMRLMSPKKSTDSKQLLIAMT
jgi:hypothetical protein